MSGEDASADLSDQEFINNIISGPNQFVHPHGELTMMYSIPSKLTVYEDTLRVAGEALLEVSNDNVDNGTTLSPAQITGTARRCVCMNTTR